MPASHSVGGITRTRGLLLAISQDPETFSASLTATNCAIERRGKVQNGTRSPRSVRDIYLTASESDQRARGWRIRDRRHVGGGDRGRPLPGRLIETLPARRHEGGGAGGAVRNVPCPGDNMSTA